MFILTFISLATPALSIIGHVYTVWPLPLCFNRHWPYMEFWPLPLYKHWSYME